MVCATSECCSMDCSSVVEGVVSATPTSTLFQDTIVYDCRNRLVTSHQPAPDAAINILVLQGVVQHLLNDFPCKQLCFCCWLLCSFSLRTQSRGEGRQLRQDIHLITISCGSHGPKCCAA